MKGGPKRPLLLICLDDNSNPIPTIGKYVPTMLLSSLLGGAKAPIVPLLNMPMNTDKTCTQEKSSRDIRSLLCNRRTRKLENQYIANG